MARYPQGQPVRLTLAVRDSTGTLVNASTLSLVVKKPDATSQTYSSPTNDSTGNYHQDIPTADITQLGHYQYAWTSTGVGAGVSVGGLDVFDPYEVRVLSLADAKKACNINPAVTTFDEELSEMVAAIETSLERATGGPIVTRQVTETNVEAVYFSRRLMLRYRPAVTLVSITDVSGTSLDVTAAIVDPITGCVEYKLGLPFIGLITNALTGPKFTVVYTAGWGTSVPPAIGLAAKIVIQYLWRTQRGPSANPDMGGDETVRVPGTAFTMPVRAYELISPFLLEAYL